MKTTDMHIDMLVFYLVMGKALYHSVKIIFVSELSNNIAKITTKTNHGPYSECSVYVLITHCLLS